MRLSTTLLAATIAAAYNLPASATVRITSDPGGQMKRESLCSHKLPSWFSTIDYAKLSPPIWSGSGRRGRLDRKDGVQ
jgi:hypothetical protein